MVSNSISKIASGGKNCLQTVREKVCLLPGATTVQKKFSWFTFLPGFIKPVIHYLRFQAQKPTWTERDSVCVIKFDEIHLTRLPSYDPKLEGLLGPNSDCQVLIVQGLLSEWQIPLLSEFDFTIDIETYKNVIARLYEINYIVKWSVCDQGPKNRALINSKNLNITPQNPFFTHPSNPNIKVFFSFDSIHLFKSMGNHVRDDYCKLPSNEVFTIEDFENAIEKRGISETTKGRPITKKETRAKGQARQNVRAVRKMFSHRTADILESQNPNDTRIKEVATMCRDLADGIKAKMF